MLLVQCPISHTESMCVYWDRGGVGLGGGVQQRKSKFHCTAFCRKSKHLNCTAKVVVLGMTPGAEISITPNRRQCLRL